MIESPPPPLERRGDHGVRGETHAALAHQGPPGGGHGAVPGKVLQGGREQQSAGGVGY